MSKPKIPKPTPVIERQAYKNAPSRASLAGDDDSETRRRMIAGIATSAQGVPGAASTTKRVMAGGDQVLAPVLTGGGSNSVLTSLPPLPTGPTRGTPTGSGPSGSSSSGSSGGGAVTGGYGVQVLGLINARKRAV